VSSTRLVPQFVEAIPEDLESGVLYISMVYVLFLTIFVVFFSR
jgi:hypothetical protein